MQNKDKIIKEAQALAREFVKEYYPDVYQQYLKSYRSKALKIAIPAAFFVFSFSIVPLALFFSHQNQQNKENLNNIFVNNNCTAEFMGGKSNNTSLMNCNEFNTTCPDNLKQNISSSCHWAYKAYAAEALTVILGVTIPIFIGAIVACVFHHNNSYSINKPNMMKLAEKLISDLIEERRGNLEAKMEFTEEKKQAFDEFKVQFSQSFAGNLTNFCERKLDKTISGNQTLLEKGQNVVKFIVATDTTPLLQNPVVSEKNKMQQYQNL